MTGPFSERRVLLQRDALTTPWGFRLQGGKDFKTPLTVQRVFVGSPADGELHRGDIILGIDNNDAHTLTHKAAQDIIKNAGGSMGLIVKSSSPPRAGPPQAASHPPQQQQNYRSNEPKPAPPYGVMFGGTDYSRGPGSSYQQVKPPTGPGPRQDNNMMSKVNQSLSHALWTPEEDNYQAAPVRDIKQMFSQPTNVATHHGPLRGRRPRGPPPPMKPLVDPEPASTPVQQYQAPPQHYDQHAPQHQAPQHQAPQHQAPQHQAPQHKAPQQAQHNQQARQQQQPQYQNQEQHQSYPNQNQDYQDYQQQPQQDFHQPQQQDYHQPQQQEYHQPQQQNYQQPQQQQQQQQQQQHHHQPQQHHGGHEAAAEEDAPEPQLSVRELTRQYPGNHPPASSTLPRGRTRGPGHGHHQPASHSPNRGGAWRKPDVTTSQRSLVEPGWAPQPKLQAGYVPGPPSAAPPLNTFNMPNAPQHRQSAPPHPQQHRQQHPQQHYQHQAGSQRPISHEDPGPPAWQGSLRGSNSSKAWDSAAAQQFGGGEAMQQHQPAQHHEPAHHAPAPQPHQPRVQNMHYGPEGQRYEQDAAGTGDNASVKHLQYNTPIGLYSKQNASEVLVGQTSGRPGEGTMGITGGGPNKEYNPASSDVYRLIHEEEGRPRGHGLRTPQAGAPQGHSPAQHHSPAQQGSYQGPSMQALEYSCGPGGEGQGGMATSDF